MSIPTLLATILAVNSVRCEATAFSSYTNPHQIAHDLKERFQFHIKKLPLHGAAKHQPWSSTYWPSFMDSINYRWAGADILSPIEKYEKAFNATGLAKEVSKRWGKNAERMTYKNADGSVMECQQDSDCPYGKNESACITRDTHPQRVCMATWDGLCHAWSTAAIAEDAPKAQVVVNGVLFDVNDLLALTILSYDYTFEPVSNGVKLRWYSRTCDVYKRDMKFDRFGRPVEADCNDLTAGAFHVILTNVIGIEKKGFFINKNMDREIWNQAVANYKVKEMRDLSVAEALEVFGASSISDSPLSELAQSFVYVRTLVTYAEEINPRYNTHVTYNSAILDLTYILELDAAGRIIGGEWCGKSQENRPGYVVFYMGRKADGAAFNGKLQWHHLNNMLRISRGETPIY